MSKKGKRSGALKPTSLQAGFVLAVDIVEHSQRPTPHQSACVTELIALLNRCQTFVEAKAKGQVVTGPAGDGFVLAFHEDALAPIRCAEELLRLAVRSGKFKLRLAVHIGPIQEVSDVAGQRNIVGEGVNYAARALDACGPNEIVLTRRASEFAREAPEYSERLDLLEPIGVKHGERLPVLRLRGKLERRQDPLEHYLGAAKRRFDSASRRGLSRPASIRVIASRLKELNHELLIGLLAIPVGLLLHYALEHSDFGRRTRLAAYDYLQGLIQPSSRELPVTFIDFEQRLNKSAENEATDLQALGRLVDAIAEQKPASIAIDIDFGPRAQTPATSEQSPAVNTDEVYLDPGGVVLNRALEWSRKGVPVFLAVYQGLHYEDPIDWLGKEEFIPLVVHPLRPDDALYGQVVMIGQVDLGSHKVPSLAEKLAETYLSVHNARAGATPWFATPYSEFGHEIFNGQLRSQEEKGRSYGLIRIEGPLYLLNASAIEDLRRASIPVARSTTAEDLAAFADRIRGKAVLIGSSNYRGDEFTLPVTGRTYPGPLFHALSVHTMTSAPLFELRRSVSWGLVVLSGLLTLTVGQWWRRKGIAFEEQGEHRRTDSILTALAVLAIIGVAVLLAAQLRVLWSDFVFVAILLAFHPMLHARIEHWAERRRHA